MCPGLTSKGGVLPTCKKDEVVAVLAEDKQIVLAIGLTTMSPIEM